MVFSKWKGRNVVRELVTPHNPQTVKQVGVRVMMAFLASVWKPLTAPEKATWVLGALARSISSFNEYIGHNLLRWQQFNGPSQATPAAEASAGLTISAHQFTGGQGNVVVELTPSAATAIWGFAIFRDDAEITAPNWTNCVAVIAADGANEVQWTDSPLVAGTYHYRACVLNDDGVMGTVLADGTAVVT
jgi:hypothetical protein